MTNVKITNVRTTPPVTISPPLKWTQLTHRCSMFVNVWMDSKVSFQKLTLFVYSISKYPGEFCEENIDDCENHGCEAGGRCVDGVGTFSCLCPRGFSGRLCEVDEDECRDNPCSHGATCRDGPGESVFYTFIIHFHLDIFDLFETFQPRSAASAALGSPARCASTRGARVTPRRVSTGPRASPPATRPTTRASVRTDTRANCARHVTINLQVFHILFNCQIIPTQAFSKTSNCHLKTHPRQKL